MNKRYESIERVYVNDAGEVCAENDPDVARLLYAVGDPVEKAEAVRQGIVEADADVEVEVVSEATTDGDEPAEDLEPVPAEGASEEDAGEPAVSEDEPAATTTTKSKAAPAKKKSAARKTTTAAARKKAAQSKKEE